MFRLCEHKNMFPIFFKKYRFDVELIDVDFTIFFHEFSCYILHVFVTINYRFCSVFQMSRLRRTFLPKTCILQAREDAGALHILFFRSCVFFQTFHFASGGCSS